MRHQDGLQVLIALDQLANTLLCGYADETMSARAWRHYMDGSRSWSCRLIDTLFFWQKDHCKTAWESEMSRAHLPPSMREVKDVQ